MRKMWVFIPFMFAMLSVNVYAQMLPSLSQLPDGKQAGGVGYTNYGSHWVRFDFEYGFTDRTKSASITELAFSVLPDGTLDGLNIDSYHHIVHTEPLGTADLDYFLLGFVGFHGKVARGATTASGAPIYNVDRPQPSFSRTSNRTLDRVSIGGGGGFLSHALGTFKPFVGLTYTRFFPFSDNGVGYGLWSIIPGFEFDISSHIGIVGQISLDHAPGVELYKTVGFFIGLRFH